MADGMHACMHLFYITPYVPSVSGEWSRLCSFAVVLRRDSSSLGDDINSEVMTKHAYQE